MVPIKLGTFEPVEVGFDGVDNWCLRSSAGDVKCFSQETLTPSGGTSDCPTLYTAALTPLLPFKATALSVSAVGFGGLGPLLFARQSNSLYAIPEGVSPSPIPILTASEAPTTCK